MATEEVVKSFTNELSSIKNVKSALSKEKIISITKAAMGALRYYKHVIYAVEKFLTKCNVKLKIPGIYIIDSIVRQGQKQFKHKDVFGPRFAVNLLQTVEGVISSCPVEDRLKVVRVINLWRDHDVFKPEITNSLIEMFRRHNLETDVAQVEYRVKGSKADMSIYKNLGAPQKKRGTPRTPPPPVDEILNGNADAQTLSEVQFNELFSRMYPTLADGLNKDKESLKKSFKIFQSKLKDSVEREKATSGGNISKLLTNTFDYSDEEDETTERSKPESISRERVEALARNICEQSEFVSEVQSTLSRDSRRSYSRDDRNSERDRGYDRNVIVNMGSVDKSRDSRRKRSRSPSRSERDPRKKKHREKTPDKKGKRRSRSRTPESSADKDREKERKRNGLPTHPKRDCLVLATRTLWFGRLPTNCTDHNIKDGLKVSGYEPEKVNIISSRACAYVTMPSRRAAFKIMDKYKRDIKISDRSVKVDWATGVGLQKNDRLMDYWDADKGYAQIPYYRLSNDIGQLIQGNFIDVDTLPGNLKGKYHSTGPVESDPIQPPADPDQQMIVNIPTPQSSQSQPVPPPFPPLPTNPPPNGALPQLPQQLQGAFPNLGLAPHLLQPNILAMLAQQQNLDQLMSQFQTNNLVPQPTGAPPPIPPVQAEQPETRGPRPPFPRGGGPPRFPNHFNSPRAEGQNFFRGGPPDFRGRGRGQFRGGRPPFRGGPPRFDGPRPRFDGQPDFSGNANMMPLGQGPMNIPPPDISALIAAGLQLPPHLQGLALGLPPNVSLPPPTQMPSEEAMNVQDDEMDVDDHNEDVRNDGQDKDSSFKLTQQQIANLVGVPPPSSKPTLGPLLAPNPGNVQDFARAARIQDNSFSKRMGKSRFNNPDERFDLNDTAQSQLNQVLSLEQTQYIPPSKEQTLQSQESSQGSQDGNGHFNVFKGDNAIGSGSSSAIRPGTDIGSGNSGAISSQGDNRAHSGPNDAKSPVNDGQEPWSPHKESDLQHQEATTPVREPESEFTETSQPQDTTLTSEAHFSPQRESQTSFKSTTSGNEYPTTTSPQNMDTSISPPYDRTSATHDAESDDSFKQRLGLAHNDSYEENPFQNGSDEDNQPKSPEEKFTNGHSPMKNVENPATEE
ncbi:unnamed protein product [Bursaphelenchus okinawaensis]|uniref:CID domain-containing protein n=1 Tax=Bursaphelenchus okinawaensis TaxID=465554 RepID=A0A811JUF3_9BILA|nr:unnamed protein product [Bursaphelenchus okinawaensis]CAG9084285.1 unnamed protein product [Bursaphelenchus okinawaensis]